MKGRPGGIPPRGRTALAAVSALAIAGACDGGPAMSRRPHQDLASRQHAAGLRSARRLLQEGHTHDARVTLRFVSQQVNVTYDSEGRVQEGDPSTVETVSDVWTFARSVKSKDPNWQLVETRTTAE